MPAGGRSLDFGDGRSPRTDRAAIHSVRARVAALDWAAIGASLDAHGAATTGPLLDARGMRGVAGLYDEERRFRSRVVMARHGFGRGEYKYLAYPLPPLVAELRTALYPQLAPIANRWNAALGMRRALPRDACRLSRALPCGRPDAADAAAPPLRAGDYNCLHQDLYGEQVVSAAGRRSCSRSPGAISPAASSC